MKIKMMVLSCLISAVVLFVGYEYSRAESEADKQALRIGVVSVPKVLQDCKRSAKYRQETAAERDRIIAELQKLRVEIEAEEAGLKTLKAGSNDHMAMVKEVLQKRAIFQAQQKFYEQQMALKERRIVEELYKDILRAISEVAEQKDLDLVFEKTEPKFPASSAEDLDRTISTHKLLYSGDCLDITSEVTARLDAKK